MWNLIKNTRSPLSTNASRVFHSKGFTSQIIAFLLNYINIVGLVYFPTNLICKKKCRESSLVCDLNIRNSTLKAKRLITAITIKIYVQRADEI